MTSTSTEVSKDQDYDLRVREIALREAVKRAASIDRPVDVLAMAVAYSKFLRTGLAR
jgi:hypothetical protein